MRALIIALLLVLVPLQASWAAVSGYCQHEDGTAAQHVGHHEHHHDSQLTNDAAENANLETASLLERLGTTDSDCASCHVSSTAILAPTASQVSGNNRSATLSELADRALSAVTEPPERPNWSSFA